MPAFDSRHLQREGHQAQQDNKDGLDVDALVSDEHRNGRHEDLASVDDKLPPVEAGLVAVVKEAVGGVSVLILQPVSARVQRMDLGDREADDPQQYRREGDAERPNQGLMLVSNHREVLTQE